LQQALNHFLPLLFEQDDRPLMLLHLLEVGLLLVLFDPQKLYFLPLLDRFLLDYRLRLRLLNELMQQLHPQFHDRS
jgi:hypothetical protein